MHLNNLVFIGFCLGFFSGYDLWGEGDVYKKTFKNALKFVYMPFCNFFTSRIKPLSEFLFEKIHISFILLSVKYK